MSIGGTLGGIVGIIIALPLYILLHASYQFFEKDIQKGVEKLTDAQNIPKKK